MALIQSRTVKSIFAGVVGVAMIGGVWIAADWWRERQAENLADSRAQEIVAMLGLDAIPNFHSRIDKVRTFINDNSVHKVDQLFWGNRGNGAAILIAYARGLSTEPAHMECSTRSNLMTGILGALGYETRIIAIFNSRTNLKSHSFLEVMNPETGRWETQDPDYDIYWRSKTSAERVSLADTADAIGVIEPCGRESCGWDHVSREGIRAEKLIDYLDIVSITSKQKTVRYALYTSRADLSATYSKGTKRGTFCQVEAKRCGQGFFDITKYSAYAAGLPR